LSQKLLKIKKKKSRVNNLTRYIITQVIGLGLDASSLVVFFLFWNALVSVCLMALGSFATIINIGLPLSEDQPKGKKLELKETNSTKSYNSKSKSKY